MKMDLVTNATAKEIQVGDEILISIVTYAGWEKVTKITPKSNGTLFIETGIDGTFYHPNEMLQIKDKE